LSSESSASCGANGQSCAACPAGQQCTSTADGQTSNGQCCAIYEICDNGIDDNCDGKTDCADPQCTQSGGPNGAGQWACEPLPTGTASSGHAWEVVAFDQTNKSVACPTNYNGGTSVYDSNIAWTDDTCGCTCTNTKTASCTGKWCDSFYTSTQSTCPSPTYGQCRDFDTTGNPDLNQDCETAGYDVVKNDYYVGHGVSVATSAGSCNATSSVDTKPAPTYDMGEACSLPQAGAGCGANQCVPVSVSNFSLCAMVSGAVTCPAGLNSYTVYASVTDTRSCSGCSCDGNSDLSCDATNFTFFQTTDCNASTNNCNPVSGPVGFEYPADTCSGVGGNGCTSGNCMQSYCVVVKHTGDPASCSVHSASTPAGSVSGTSQYTVCCAP
jgi:hypothetical protein